MNCFSDRFKNGFQSSVDVIFHQWEAKIYDLVPPLHTNFPAPPVSSDWSVRRVGFLLGSSSKKINIYAHVYFAIILHIVRKVRYGWTGRSAVSGSIENERLSVVRSVLLIQPIHAGVHQTEPPSPLIS